MSKIWISIQEWIINKFIQDTMLVIPATSLIFGIFWGLLTSLFVIDTNSLTPVFMGHIGFFLPIETNLLFYYGFVTGLFYGFFIGLFFYIPFAREIHEIDYELRSKMYYKIKPLKKSTLSKNIERLYLITIAIVYLYSINETYINPGNIKDIFDISEASIFLFSLSFPSLLITVVMNIISRFKPHNKIYENIAKGFYSGFKICFTIPLGVNILWEIFIVPQNLVF